MEAQKGISFRRKLVESASSNHFIIFDLFLILVQSEHSQFQFGFLLFIYRSQRRCP